ncbi:FecR family protein [Alistipes sp.]|uniref:FecR family protein n=1 Tax=Alistipes sp. TaxID=1872444 RepID=UPI003AF063FD
MDPRLLLKYQRNETSQEELIEVLDWLDASEENRQELDRLDFISNLDMLTAPTQPAARKRTASRWRIAAQWSAGIAAALLLCAWTGRFLAEKTIERHARQMMTISVPNGQSMSVVLSDGTTVWLNSGSRLEYPSIFSPSKRRVCISGEALFEVVHDAARPFVVETYACEAEVLGTKFNIRADAGAQRFSAALLEGRLKISNLRTNESVILQPDDQVDLIDGHLQLNRIADSDDFRWIEGLMNLNTLSFEEVIRKFEDYYGIRITVDKPQSIPRLKYHGKIRVSNGVDHALKLVQTTSNFFTYTFDDESNTIHIKII